MTHCSSMYAYGKSHAYRPSHRKINLASPTRSPARHLSPIVKLNLNHVFPINHRSRKRKKKEIPNMGIKGIYMEPQSLHPTPQLTDFLSQVFSTSSPTTLRMPSSSATSSNISGEKLPLMRILTLPPLPLFFCGF